MAYWYTSKQYDDNLIYDILQRNIAGLWKKKEKYENLYFKFYSTGTYKLRLRNVVVWKKVLYGRNFVIWASQLKIFKLERPLCMPITT